MSKNKSLKIAKKKVELRKRGWIPTWLYMTLSFVVPLYGIIYYVLIKEKDNKRARIALLFAILGCVFWLFFKLIVWLR